MFSKLAVVCASEADGCLGEPVSRQYWVHPFHSDRENSKRFLTFFNSIREHELKFFDYYRMSRSSFDEIQEKQNKQVLFFKTRLNGISYHIVIKYLTTKLRTENVNNVVSGLPFQ